MIPYGVHLGPGRAVRISTAVFGLHAPLLALVVYASIPRPWVGLATFAAAPLAGAVFGRLLHWIFCGRDFEELAYPLNVGSLLGLACGAVLGAIAGHWLWISLGTAGLSIGVCVARAFHLTEVSLHLLQRSARRTR
jgi:hypothetical protein